MCKRKPGPRCSPDTLKHLTRVTSHRDALSEDLSALEEATSQGVIVAEIDYAEMESLQHRLAEANAEVEKARLTYNTSTKGLTSLEHARASTELYSQQIPYYGLGKGDVRFIEFPEFSAYSAELEFLHAKGQREWQAETLRKLEKAEKLSPTNAEALCNTLVNEVNTRVNNMEDSVSIADLNVKKAAGNVVSSKGDESTVDSLRQAYREYNNLRLASAYAKMQLEDLLAYKTVNRQKKISK